MTNIKKKVKVLVLFLSFCNFGQLAFSQSSLARMDTNLRTISDIDCFVVDLVSYNYYIEYDKYNNKKK